MDNRLHLSEAIQYMNMCVYDMYVKELYLLLKDNEKWMNNVISLQFFKIYQNIYRTFSFVKVAVSFGISKIICQKVVLTK